MNSKYMQRRRQSGFTVLELMGVLLVFSFIILSAHRIITLIDQTREYNQLADQSKQFSNLAIQYIQDNYRNLVEATASGNDTIIPASIISGYKPDIFLDINKPINKRYQTPCIYITHAGNNSIRAYLIFGNSLPHSTNLDQLEIAKIAKIIGAHAGTLTNKNGNYVFTGGIENNLSLSSSAITNISNTCGFPSPLPKNSLMLDLSKNIALFASIKGTIDQQSFADTPDPSLKKAGLTTMQTNIYLDNIYQEKSSTTNYYCDVAQLPVNDASLLCQKYASGANIFMYPGTASWTGSVQTGDHCVATAEARFYRIAESYSCDGVNMGNPADYCPVNLNGKIIDSGSGYWNPNPGTLNGDQCTSHVYAYYKSPGICDGDAWWINTNNPVSRGDGDTPPNWQRAVSGGKMGSNLAGFISCAVKQVDDHNSMVHCPGTYNQATGMCDIGLKCLNSIFGCVSRVVNTSFAPTAGGQRDPSSTDCGLNTVAAIQAQSTIDLGIKDCGSSNYPILSSTTSVPAQHIYRAIDYGTSNISNGRIQIKSRAPTGSTSESSILGVNNAGLQAGFIMPLSHLITAGGACDSAQLGKISQDMNSITINSQVQCTYNPTFCTGSGYCYLPIKNTTFDYQFVTLQAGFMCPIGTVVDSNQPSGNIDIATPCPVIANWNLTEGVHGEDMNCYTSVTNMKFCQGYQTVCTYSQGKQQVSGLLKLRCSASTNTYLIDNYTQ